MRNKNAGFDEYDEMLYSVGVLTTDDDLYTTQMIQRLYLPHHTRGWNWEDHFPDIVSKTEEMEGYSSAYFILYPSMLKLVFTSAILFL